MPISFACISPHPPIILPSVGSSEDRAQVKKTIESLEKLEKKFREIKPDKIIICSPHPDWGIKVPLHFLTSKIKNQNAKLQTELPKEAKGKKKTKFSSPFKIKNYQSPENITIELSEPSIIYPILTTFDSPKQHFEWGKKLYLEIKNRKLKIGLIASGDLSHCLKQDGPYGFHPHGPKFDQTFIQALKKKDIETILKLDKMYLESAECGLRSFSFVLGILEASGLNWKTEILSYQAPFGVGYLVANFELLRQNSRHR